MRNDVAHQPDHAKKTRPPPVKSGETADHTERREQHEGEIDRGARADRGHKRNAGRRAGDEAGGFLIKRCHQATLRDVQEVAPIDDLGEVGLELATATRELWRGGKRRGQIADDRARRIAIVLDKRKLGAGPKLFDRGEPEQSDDFTDANDKQRQACERCQRRAKCPEPGRARIKIFNERNCGEARAEHDQPAECGPKNSTPRKATFRRDRRLDGDRQIEVLRLRDHPHRPTRGTGFLVRHDDLRVVQPECRRFASHARRSPSRNCSARSRRMWGRVGEPVTPGSEGGGRKRRKR